MPLTLKRGSGAGKPVGGHDLVAHVRCDHCGESLYPRVGGTVVWEPDPQRPYLEVAFVHRSCREGHAEGRDADFVEMDLASFLRAAIHNLEVAG
ncbi:MAG: hypothetical protein ACOC83_07730 [Gemmatimonadota bacterium]